jgi:hypothetical protein
MPLSPSRRCQESLVPNELRVRELAVENGSIEVIKEGLCIDFSPTLFCF